ncbi:MAG: SIS domain-containing protein [Verrucomicrobiales bacterium]|nr:SIS domain-containing protein [Verrucomicrobiales bacterium]
MTEPEFLQVADDFQLGMLDTERPHPATTHLSEWAKNDLPAGIAALKLVDHKALEILCKRLPDLIPLAEAIRLTIDRGNKVFLCGCGATGRLSISLEIFARTGLLHGAHEKNVTGFMAGGDAALIRSIERFEDRPDYGERQLRDLGFSDGDLLISSTEGGETPFVIGATQLAASVSRQKPWFLYCNPDDLLCANVERSRLVIEDERIRKINLSVGPMALSGSTRMQASTVLMAAIGFAMKHSENPDGMAADFDRWCNWVCEDLDWGVIQSFIEAESQVYDRGGYVMYEPGGYGLTVLTDTTERSPTFTLTPFERDGVDEPVSLSYLWIRNTATAREAWRAILHRNPNPVEWGALRHLTSGAAMRAFDFSNAGRVKRFYRTGGKNQVFSVSRKQDGIALSFCETVKTLPVPDGIDFFGENLALKMLLNAHSTLIMGRLGRYEDNLMTYVSANNFKLIDRAVRYVRLLLERHHGLDIPYREVAEVLLAEKEALKPDEPVVLKTVDTILAQNEEEIPED